VAVNFVKVIRVRAVVVMFAHVVVAVVAVVVLLMLLLMAVCTLSVLTAKRSARKKPHRISCDMPQYFPLTR